MVCTVRHHLVLSEESNEIDSTKTKRALTGSSEVTNHTKRTGKKTAAVVGGVIVVVEVEVQGSVSRVCFLTSSILAKRYPESESVTVC